ncbi:MAG: rod shape-determining protein MreC [Bryobacterales bacterium]|nr:rod shape-determining protein MreC [Bryobacteraceae bacterium]MDW8353371.1 rod shape-determining protein MreC [Bryobacterales bacterium]
MERVLARYRHLAVMLAVLTAQLVLLAYQVKTGEDVRLIRVWAVSVVTPLARLLDTARDGGKHVVQRYVHLVGVQQENDRLRVEVDRLRMENRYLKQELATAERARVLAEFRTRHPSRTLAARVIAASSAPGTKAVIVDRGSGDGVRKGMAVITPAGVVGKVIAVYPTAAQVLLITDPSFAAGVITETHRIQGTLKGTGQRLCRVDYLQNEEKIEPGEWFYTSGEDLVFPRGLPVGRVRSVSPGRTFKEVMVEPSGMTQGLGEVLIVLEGVHQPVPGEAEVYASEVQLLPAPMVGRHEDSLPTEAFLTDADRIREHYRRLGEAQGHVFGEGAPGSKPPDFNWRPDPSSGTRFGSTGSIEPRLGIPNPKPVAATPANPHRSPATTSTHGSTR